MDRSTIRLHMIRVLLIAILSLFITHFFTYNKLPGDVDYQFPLESYMIIFLFGLTICTINWIVYVRMEIDKIRNDFRRFMVLVALNVLVTVVSYSILFPLINVWILGRSFSSVAFFKFLFVVLMIILIEFSFIFIYKLLNKKIRKLHGQFFIDTGTTRLIIDTRDILCFRSQSKMIKVFLKSKKSYYVQYTSLEEVSEALNGSPFFRINRQYIVNKEAIESVKREGDRRLLVNLESLPAELSSERIRVSRYRNKDFSDWFSNPDYLLAD